MAVAAQGELRVVNPATLELVGSVPTVSTEAVQEASMQGARREHTCWYVTDEQRSMRGSCTVECQGISRTGH